MRRKFRLNFTTRVCFASESGQGVISSSPLLDMAFASTIKPTGNN